MKQPVDKPINQAEVLKHLQDIFDEIFISPIKVTPELSAQDVEEWDSLLQISLLVLVQRTFSIRFHLGEVEETKNIGEFANLILLRTRDE